MLLKGNNTKFLKKTPANDSDFTIFVYSIRAIGFMKYSEFFKLAKRKGWQLLR
jgi:hypothetical protein